MNGKIIEHLMTRPISSIVINSMEKDNDIALKLMCIIDYYLEKHDLYPRISNVPKLLEQLLRLKSYGSFRYFKYVLKKSLLRDKLLQCDCCEFIAPYIVTLEHMVLNHNRHKSSTICQWCDRTDLNAHENCNTLNNCYMQYRIKNHLNVNEYPRVIDEFYNVLTKVAAKLDVLCNRTRFQSRNTYSIETIELFDDDDDDISNEIHVTQPSVKASKKPLNINAVEKLFDEAMYFFNVPTFTNSVVPVHTKTTNNRTVEPITAPIEYGNQSPMSSVSSYYPPHHMRSPLPSFALTPPLRTSDLIAPPITLNEIRNFTNFAGSTLNNMYNESIKRKTLFQMQQILLQASAEDMNFRFQMDGLM